MNTNDTSIAGALYRRSPEPDLTAYLREIITALIQREKHLVNACRLAAEAGDQRCYGTRLALTREVLAWAGILAGLDWEPFNVGRCPGPARHYELGGLYRLAIGLEIRKRNEEGRL